MQIGEKREETKRAAVPIMRRPSGICLEQLTNPEWGCLKSVSEVAAIGFKAVFAGRLSGVRLVDEELLSAMETLADVAPAHNPPYARAMRELQQAFPQIPLVAALETGFHETIPEAQPDLRGPLRMEDRARRAAVGLSRRQSPLHRRTDRPRSSGATICGSSPATWAAATRCARSAADSRWPPAWA